jgi:CBS domain containing-hemolysin-like protein
LLLHEKEELEEEKKHATKLLPLLEDHHRLLVTLLILNSLCAEALPIFLDAFLPSSVAVLLGVVFLLVFGEILPSAIFTGPAGMRTSASLTPLVRFFLFIFAPVAVPFGRFLDWWVGDEEEKIYNRSQLLALLRLHAGKATGGKLITVKQSRMMQGAMDLMHVTAEEVMTPVDKMFMISTEKVLNLSELAEIVGKGYSRIPVYEKSNRDRVRGVLLTKTLAVVNPNDDIPVGNLFARSCGCVTPGTHLYEVLAMMRATKSHMCLVTEDPIRMSKIMHRSGTSSSLTKEPPKLLGCLSLHDIVACVVAGEVADEYSSRRPPRVSRATLNHEDSDFEDNSDDGLDDNANQNGETIPIGEHRIAIKSKFARESIMRWVERARLSAKLNAETVHQRQQDQQVALGRTERTPLMAASTSQPDHTAKSSAVARRLLNSWLLKKTGPPTLSKAQVTKTLRQVASAGDILQKFANGTGSDRSVTTAGDSQRSIAGSLPQRIYSADSGKSAAQSSDSDDNVV